MPPIPYTAALYLAVIQFLFASTWTIYVIYLPQLLMQAGIDSQWLRWILLCDQLTFIFMDIGLGFAADKVQRAVGKLGGVILKFSLVSCVAFLAIPQGLSATGLLVLLFIWVISSSALRVPLLVLLGKYTAKPQLPMAIALQSVGLAVAGSIAPYLGMYLTTIDPRIPFFISSITLLLAISGLVYVEKWLQRQATTATSTPSPVLPVPPVMLFIIAYLCAGIGFQVHSAFNGTPQLLQFVSKAELPYLLPIFWIGFNLLIFPMGLLIKRLGVFPVLIGVSVLAAGCAFFATIATTLTQLLIAQFFMGGFWGSMFIAGITAALNLGKTGKEGMILGLWSSMLAMAAFLRIGLSLSGWQETTEIQTLLPLLPVVFWASVAGLLIIMLRIYRQPAR
ncbi:MFS transporter [Beggiatoa leptomitoformis]|uniref:MFS transporter n=1 Tax=Beggiatoa leptomitoformis TaxID=288004 RepID=A0A2N9YDE9_9GAMM|nr:MFS transporter [Beggiatoa leptomitoformis]ALG69067.1 MFS transporter [Beggiatoa leptomitoformis]AUI68523.1 MFS transporter [Beggiatoa leptomitoformis]